MLHISYHILYIYRVIQEQISNETGMDKDVSYGQKSYKVDMNSIHIMIYILYYSIRIMLQVKVDMNSIHCVIYIIL